MNFDDLKAGHELDTLIAERVMGEKVPQAWSDPSVGPSHGDPGGYRIGVKPYSVDIRFAWEAAEKMGIGVLPYHGDERPGYVAGFDDDSKDVMWYEEMLYTSKGSWAFAPTAPLAICKAALLASAYSTETPPQ